MKKYKFRKIEEGLLHQIFEQYNIRLQRFCYTFKIFKVTFSALILVKKKQGRKELQSICVSSNAIRGMSRALKFMKVW